MSSAVQKYGKQTIKELLDMVMIKGNITNQEAYDLLLRNGHITKRTKHIDSYYGKSHQFGIKDNGCYGQLSTFNHTIYIMNGTGRHIIDLYFKDEEIPLMLEELV